MHACRSTLEDPTLGRFPELALGSLGREHARAVLERSGPLAPAERERLLDAADGIPLALLELPRGALGAGLDGGSSVERAFAERVAALPEPARRALLLAATDDDPEGRTALLALSSPADLAPAEAAGLIRIAGERVAFRHPLVRSATYGLSSFPERRDAHAALAAALSRPADCDRRAWHRAAAAAAPDAEVATELARSADRARARGGDAAAAAALERAARLTSDQPVRAQRLVAAADAARIAGDAEHALELAGEALGLANGDTAAEATAVRGAVHSHRGDAEAAEADLRAAARALAQRQPARALRVALLAGEAAALCGHHREAAEIAAWAAALPAGEGDAERAVLTFADGVAHTFAGRHREAAERFGEMAAPAERSGDPELLTWAAMATLYAGDVAGCRRRFAQAVTAARDRGAVWHVTLALGGVAWAESLEGRLSPAGTDATEALALAAAADEPGAAAQARALLAWHAGIRGREDECRALTDEALSVIASRPMRFAAESAQRALALLDLALGRHEAAFDRLAAFVEDPRAHPVRRLLVVGDLVEAAAGCGRAAAAQAAVDHLAAWTAATSSAWGKATVAGAAVTLASDAAAAEPAYARALEAHAAIELPFDRARLELRFGELLRRARRRVDARTHLRSAVDTFAQLGAEPWEQRAAAELRATGETARRRDASTLDDLTPQERQIAQMVAEGATNRDVAGRLFLSPRTVDYHLRKVFQKIGVTSRTQLAGLDW